MGDRLLDQMVALTPRMRAYAIALSGSTADADDIVQETLLRAWRFREGYAEGTNLKAWLFRILRNQFLDSAHRKRLTVEDVDGHYASQLIYDPDQEFVMEYGELLRALQTLSPETREAVLLTLGSGFTYEEAAELCDCAVGTLKSRLHRGRRMLMELIDAAPPPGKPSD